jgi:ribosomal protein S18 acetylase RimI-like enzyme
VPAYQSSAGHRARSGEPVIEATLQLQLLGPNDWQRLRAARLAAMLDSPRAFTSSYARESVWGELDWRRLFDAAIWIAACEAENVIGLARSVGEPGRLTTRHIESVWVAPTHRRRGVCRTLLLALAEMARAMGAHDLLLWVLEDNHDAQRAYKALGFEPTGKQQFLKPFERFEQQLRLEIRRLLETDAHPIRLVHLRLPGQLDDVADSGSIASTGTANNGLFGSMHESDLVPSVKQPSRALDIELGPNPLSC